jgi:hypothetical protein
MKYCTVIKDMNSRELLQRRRMLENGDTVWEDGQLVKAAKRGHLCVLDGLDRGEETGSGIFGTEMTRILNYTGIFDVP